MKVPTDYLNSIVSISYEWTDGSTWRSQATGFLYGRRSASGRDDVFLVTSEHCFQDAVGNNRQTVLISLNPRGNSPAIIAELPLSQGGFPLWTSLPGIDLAVLRIGLRELSMHNVDFVYFRSDRQMLTAGQLRNIDCGIGEPIFILGFEAGLPEVRRNHPIMRSGTIARIGDLYEGDSYNYIAEATVFAGNSGGPVFLSTDSDCARENSIKEPLLIGVVSAYWSYAKEIVTANGSGLQAYFSENKGLCCIWPTDYIEMSIDQHLLRFGQLAITA